jgi:hypothetical protein
MAMGNVLQQALAGMQNPLAPPPSAAGSGPGPQAGAAPAPSLHAEEVHRRRSDQFAHAAISSFIKGEITRQHLADALADQEAYDWQTWREQNVVHPTRAVAHNEAPPEPPQSLAGPG